MVNPVSSAIVARVVTFTGTFALGVVGVVADKSGAADQQVKQEAEHLHADGDEEEDERVPPLVGDQQLGEDARQGDDHPGCAWEGQRERRTGDGGVKIKRRVRIEERKTEKVRRRRERKSEKGKEMMAGMCVSVLTLSSHHPLCVPLGQHPHVTIETGLLHWGGMRKWLSAPDSQHRNKTIYLAAQLPEPPHTTREKPL